MVQVPKDRMKERFVAAAAETFAELGFAGASMAAVAERAGSSVGNLYKYFAGKQQLFDAAVPPDFVSELRRRTRARVQALGSAKDVRELSEEAQNHALGGELLDYCLGHRSQILPILPRYATREAWSPWCPASAAAARSSPSQPVCSCTKRPTASKNSRRS